MLAQSPHDPVNWLKGCYFLDLKKGKMGVEEEHKARFIRQHKGILGDFAGSETNRRTRTTDPKSLFKLVSLSKTRVGGEKRGGCDVYGTVICDCS